MQMDPRNNQQDTPDGIKQGENKSLVKGKTVFSQRPNHAILLNYAGLSKLMHPADKYQKIPGS
ncbi:hypothetical protein MNBD_GAMMA10-357 [hydrothermal vent metagenome]|uniref:Uncharacterized protein n=1 Tax=hydrothermal vent metagenome TaxID=652676 RepID=A0A3B0XDB3_9ZZZZ